MPSTELGFLEETEWWRLQSHFFPSKVGGKPAWLSLKPLPTFEELCCATCSKVMSFLCQLYAPFGSGLSNFHRTIFIFICRDPSCNKPNAANNIKVLRSSLPRENDFYSADPPEETPNSKVNISTWSELCNVCGILANKKCSKCRMISYCCKDHQIIDWKGGHRKNCGSSSDTNKAVVTNQNYLFPEWEIDTESEEIENHVLSEDQALEEFNKLQAEGKTGTLPEVDDLELEAHAMCKKDRTFNKFKKLVEYYPTQVIRYNRLGSPLLISDTSLPSQVPSCEYCGSERIFEFQIMPQMLYKLKEEKLDWGVILVFTCKVSCAGNDINSYKKEFVFKQDVNM